MRDLGITPQSSAVVTAIIALARSLGLRVVAEGVENLRQMEVLHRLGCGVMQGFLFSRADPARRPGALAGADRAAAQAPWIGQAGALESGADAPRAPRAAGRTERTATMDLSQGAHRSCAADGHRRRCRWPRRALRRLALDKLEPTPENYARAYAPKAASAASVPERGQGRCCSAWLRSWAPRQRARSLVQALMAGRWDEADASLDSAGRQARRRPRPGPT